MKDIIYDYFYDANYIVGEGRVPIFLCDLKTVKYA